MKISEWLELATHQLSKNGDSPALDAELLLMHVLNVDRAYLRTHDDQVLTDQQQADFNSLITRRLTGEPIAYLTGKKEFWSMNLNVTRDTLIPRPDTEILVEIVLQLVKDKNVKAADLGTGSAAIALALASERPDWQVIATDISESALLTARKNAQQFGLVNITFCTGSWCTALSCKDFIVIAANPPYISEAEWPEYAAGLQFEPRTALVSGDDGLEAIREIIVESLNYLLPGGYLVIEHGFEQAASVRDIFAANGYINIRSVTDLSKNERVSYGQKRI